MYAQRSTPKAPGYTCAQCGRLFHRPASTFKISRRTFCSPRCTGDGNRTVPPVAVYAIVHRETSAAYIGSSADISSRWSSHRCQLQEDRHPNARLTQAWTLHGADAFEWRILEAVSDSSLLIAREQAWLDRWRAEGWPLFNRAPNAGTNTGIKHAEDVVAQMRANPKRKFQGKLSRPVVLEIKHRALAGENFHALAAEFKIHRHTVYMIATGRMWPDVD